MIALPVPSYKQDFVLRILLGVAVDRVYVMLEALPLRFLPMWIELFVGCV